MALGIVGYKRGMSRIFSEDGTSVPVTVIEAAPNRIACLRTPERNGYRAIQVTWGKRRPGWREKHKRAAGEHAKAGEPGLGLMEFRLDDGEARDGLQPGAEVKVGIFRERQQVDVTGTTIGKGFAGAIKRHGFRRGGASHGNSLAHRSAGSIGQCQTPGRVFKGKKMAGHMGNVRRTLQRLEIVRVDEERNLLFVKGSVPGARGGRVVIRPTVKPAGRSQLSVAPAEE